MSTMRLTAVTLAMTLMVVLGCTRIDQVPTPTPTTAPPPATPSGLATSVEMTPTVTVVASILDATAPPRPEMRILSIPWVADGLSSRERNFLAALRTVTAANESVFWELMEKPELSDELASDEYLAIFGLRNIANSYGPHAPDVLARVLAMPFMETIDAGDSDALNTIAMMPEERPEIAARQILSEEPRIEIADEMTRGAAILYMDPADADVIGEMAWFRDGISSSAEDLYALHLYLIARESPELFDELADKPWIQESTGAAQQIVRSFSKLLKPEGGDPVSALVISRMTTMEGGGFEAQLVIEEFMRVHRRGDGWLANILANPLIDADVSADSLGKILVAELEVETPEVARALRGFGWALDAVTTDERRFFRVLSEAQTDFPELAAAIISKGWVQEGVDQGHIRFLETLVDMRGEDDSLLETILLTPWLNADIRSGVDQAVRGLIQASELGHGAIEIILEVASEAEDESTARWVTTALGLTEWSGIEDLRFVTSLPWVEDGVSDEEADTLWELGIVTGTVPGYVDDTFSLEWIRDDLNSIEARGVRALVGIAVISQHISVEDENYANAYGALVTKSWVRDGMNRTEIDVVEELRGVGYHSGQQGDEVLRRLLAMPFMAQIEGTEQSILEGIATQMKEDSWRIVDILLDTENGLAIDDDFDPANLTLFERA